MKKIIELKGEINNSVTVVGDFNTLLSIMNIKIRQRINKEMKDLNNTVNHQHLTGIYRILPPMTAKYTFF